VRRTAGAARDQAKHEGQSAYRRGSAQGSSRPLVRASARSSYSSRIRASGFQRASAHGGVISTWTRGPSPCRLSSSVGGRVRFPGSRDSKPRTGTARSTSTPPSSPCSANVARTPSRSASTETTVSSSSPTTGDPYFTATPDETSKPPPTGRTRTAKDNVPSPRTCSDIHSRPGSSPLVWTSSKSPVSLGTSRTPS
jgi:hypothetical protein